MTLHLDGQVLEVGGVLLLLCDLLHSTIECSEGVHLRLLVVQASGILSPNLSV
jgi:hypothetical protein